EIIERGGVLRVRGGATSESADADTQLLYRGIAKRNFERNFQLADNVQVSGAHLDNGLLHIELVREVPEAEKPRKINISKAAQAA
ncbi:MAG: Hsp20 family protein, partial [Pseudomonadota bacterium]|nr:Hsp20 family protein [Pseudomonadota bacterium]